MYYSSIYSACFFFTQQFYPVYSRQNVNNMDAVRRMQKKAGKNGGKKLTRSLLMLLSADG